MHEALVHEVTLQCSVAHAFKVFTQHVDLWWPPGHRKFANSTLHHDQSQGGRLIERGPNGEEFTFADILRIDPPHQMILAWHPGKITAPTQTTVTFRPAGDGQTTVRVLHEEANAALGAAWPARAAMFDKGWTAILAALKERIDTIETQLDEGK